ncbi:serine/threonine-protein kinase [Brevundimonas sp.]|uniref:serine/threonine-protein kinase n=1 Tax=Brevundimonas sp. TaxID=1871086 RepID=UPI003F6EB6A6
MRLPIGTQLNKYVLQERLGGGSFGDVYRAQDRATSSICALKCIEVDPTTSIDLVLQEARNLKACQSQHIVEIASADVMPLGASTVVLIDMEYLPDGSLEGRIEKLGISYGDALSANRHMLLGLSSAHKNGIIHKDVKPANIMIDGAIYKLSDFGISYVKQTAIGIPLTYEPNAAPELIAGGAPDERTDVYAAGMTLFRCALLYGAIGIDAQQVADWEASGRLVGLPEFIGFPRHFPRRLKAVIKTATAPDPLKRYQSAGEMLTALEKLKIAKSWRKTGLAEWSANVNGKVHRLDVAKTAKGWELCYAIDGRRRNADCSTYKTESLALKALDDAVSKSVLT